jgi:hypothetical protein
MSPDTQLLILELALILIGAGLTVALVKLINENERLRGRADRAERLLHYRRPVPHPCSPAYGGGCPMRHGYIRYTKGCRCGVCREAKAAYMREKRADLARARKHINSRPNHGRNFVDGITHGYAGYQDYSCRCEVCKAAKVAEDDRRRGPRRAAPRAARERGERYVAPGIKHGTRNGYINHNRQQ